jgi:hypothetical protein
VKRESSPASFGGTLRWLFEEREWMPGRHAEERSKIIPAQKILCMMSIPPERLRGSMTDQRTKIYRKMA